MTDEGIAPNNKKILIIDDETALALLYKANLEALGFTVEYCENGEVALQTARDFAPDLIMLDLMMPHLSGFDCIELFKTLLPNKAPYIVIVSALSQPEDMAKAKALGADDYLVKSDTPMRDVVARVSQALTGAPEPDLNLADASNGVETISPSE